MTYFLLKWHIPAQYDVFPVNMRAHLSTRMTWELIQRGKSTVKNAD